MSRVSVHHSLMQTPTSIIAAESDARDRDVVTIARSSMSENSHDLWRERHAPDQVAGNLDLSGHRSDMGRQAFGAEFEPYVVSGRNRHVGRQGVVLRYDHVIRRRIDKHGAFSLEYKPQFYAKVAEFFRLRRQFIGEK